MFGFGEACRRVAILSTSPPACAAIFGGGQGHDPPYTIVSGESAQPDQKIYCYIVLGKIQNSF